MSDTTKTILLIVAALIIVAIVIALLVLRSRRRAEEQRARARAAALAEAEDRASVTGQIASEAKAEAADSDARAAAAKAEAQAADEQARAAQEQARAAQEQARMARERAQAESAGAAERAERADRLAAEAGSHGTTASEARTRHDELLAEADRVDPDVATPPGKHPATSSFGPGAAAFEDDEPDLADAEDPFASRSEQNRARDAGARATAVTGTPPRGNEHGTQPGSSSDGDRAPDAGAGDDRGTEPVSPHDERDDGGQQKSLTGATTTEFGDPTGRDDETGRDDSDADHEDPDWVNGPVDEDMEAQPSPADADAVDWINGPAEAESVTVEVPASAAGSRDPDAPSEPTDAVLANLPEELQSASAEADEAAVAGRDAGAGGHRVSRLDEVADGGYGPGSAAPIDDGAQPLGHPVKAWRDSMTYRVPDGPGYDQAGPDVWFYTEQAARDAGFRRAGDE